LKPQTAPGGGCSSHLKLPAELPRESLNESQPRGSSLDGLQIEARAVVLDIEKKRLVLPCQPDPSGAYGPSIQPILDSVRKQFIRDQRERHRRVVRQLHGISFTIDFQFLRKGLPGAFTNSIEKITRVESRRVMRCVKDALRGCAPPLISCRNCSAVNT
jgi:hypothetical protein